MKRLVAFTTDDAQEAASELYRQRATGQRGWDMCATRLMEDPPRTVHRYAVFRKAAA